MLKLCRSGILRNIRIESFLKKVKKNLRKKSYFKEIKLKKMRNRTTIV